jgi:hypothetical protein
MAQHRAPHARSLDLSAAPLVLLSPSPPACMWCMTVVQATLCHCLSGDGDGDDDDDGPPKVWIGLRPSPRRAQRALRRPTGPTDGPLNTRNTRNTCNTCNTRNTCNNRTRVHASERPCPPPLPHSYHAATMQLPRTFFGASSRPCPPPLLMRPEPSCSPATRQGCGRARRARGPAAAGGARPLAACVCVCVCVCACVCARVRDLGCTSSPSYSTQTTSPCCGLAL